MKKVFFILFLTNIAFAQNCKFLKNEIDAFSKEKVIETNSKSLTNEISQSLDVGFFYEKSPFISMDFTFQRQTDFNVTSDKNVLFLLNNDEVISINIGNDIIPKRSSGLGVTYGGITSYKMKLPITIENLNLIKDIGINKIRLQTNEGFQEFEVKNKNKAQKIYDIIQCFIDEMKRK